MRLNNCLALTAAVGCAAIWTMFTFYQRDSIVPGDLQQRVAASNPSKVFMSSTARFLPAKFGGDNSIPQQDFCAPCPLDCGTGGDNIPADKNNKAVDCPNGVCTGTGGTKLLKDNYLPVHPLEQSNYEKEGGRLLIHSWYEGSSLFPGFEYLLKGYLVSQNLDRTLFVMWLTEDWAVSADPVKVYIIEKYRYHPNIEFRMFDKEALVVGTCWEEREEFMKKTTIQTYGMRDYSNVVRWLLLYNFGGVWLDADSIPLLDISYLHTLHYNTLLAAHSTPTDDEKKKHPDRPKEWGMFNNNFLMVTDRAIRDKIMEVACTFRRRPLLAGEKGFGNEPFVNVIPQVGDDNHEQYVMNHWLFNDGTLRNCWIREDCSIELIDLGATDPVWVRSNDMYAICERIIQSMDRYTAQFSDLLKSRTSEEGLWGYLSTHNYNSSSWIVHNRLAHCRTAGTIPIGMSKWFGDLLEQHLLGGDPLTAPAAAQNVVAYDPFENTKSDHLIKFIPLIIVVESQPEDVEGRAFVRSQLKSTDYFPDVHEAVSRVPVVFFVVPYSNAHSDWNARMHLELYTHNDMILVNPHNKDLPVNEACLVPPVLRAGILKILRTHDCRFMTILFGSPNRVYTHVRNLYYLLNTASNLALFNKEKKTKSFVITHRVDDELEQQLLRTGSDNTAEYKDKDDSKLESDLKVDIEDKQGPVVVGEEEAVLIHPDAAPAPNADAPQAAPAPNADAPQAAPAPNAADAPQAVRGLLDSAALKAVPPPAGAPPAAAVSRGLRNEEEQSRYSLPATRTVFRGFDKYSYPLAHDTGTGKSVSYTKSNDQQFVVLTRDRLPDILGVRLDALKIEATDDTPSKEVDTKIDEVINNAVTQGKLNADDGINRVEFGGQPGYVWDYVAAPDTLRQLIRRLPPHDRAEDDYKFVPGSTGDNAVPKGVRGIEAATLERFRFYGASMSYPSLDRFRYRHAQTFEEDPAPVSKIATAAVAADRPCSVPRAVGDAKFMNGMNSNSSAVVAGGGDDGGASASFYYPVWLPEVVSVTGGMDRNSSSVTELDFMGDEFVDLSLQHSRSSLHMNVTFIWDVPCMALYYDLRSAIAKLPVLFVK